MGYLSKRRGAVSVFLIIIFVVSYVFMGLLVDAGRGRMARTYAEGALDTATEAILSNYDRLLFDLYGLFGVDIKAASEEEMNNRLSEMYANYLDTTLGIIGIDHSAYTTELSRLFSETSSETFFTTKTLYDFQTEVGAGSSITLADTANVESQIIEYMKYRAPVQLVDEMDGFLKKIEEIIRMKDRVAAALERSKITDKYEHPGGGEKPLSTEATELIGRINEFAARLYDYSVQPDKKYAELSTKRTPGDVYEKNPKNISDWLKDFDTAVDSATETRDSAQNDLDEWYKEQNKHHLQYLENTVGRIGGAEDFELKSPIDGKRWFSELKITDEFVVNYHEKLSEEINEILSGKLSSLEEGSKTHEVYTNYVTWYARDAAEYEEEEEKIEASYTTAVGTARKALIEKLKTAEESAAALHEEANAIRDKVEDVAKRYEMYIANLKEAYEPHKDDESYKTVYLPELELAEANEGELLKNMALLLNSRRYTSDIADGFQNENGGLALGKCSEWLGPVADMVLQKREDKESINDANIKTNLRESVKPDKDNYTDANGSKELYNTPYKNPYIEAAQELLPLLQGHICTLYSHASYFLTGRYVVDVDVKVGEVDDPQALGKEAAKSSEGAGGEEEEKEPSTPLDTEAIMKNPAYLKVNYSYTPSSDDGLDSEAGAKESQMTNLLAAGQRLISGLESLLEGARDNLYLDAYVMSRFPNYADHYANAEETKQKGGSAAVILEEPYGSRLAFYAEVEYVITGGGESLQNAIESGEELKNSSNGPGRASLTKMEEKLFATRMLFNVLAIFTDTAKIKQANVLASWAGPLTGAVALLLLVAWAAAESALDVIDLKDGKEVELFKQGKDWKLSAEGAVKKLLSKVAEKVLDGVEELLDDGIDTLVSGMEQQTNRLICKAYNAAQGSVDEIIGTIKEEGKEQIAAWSVDVQDKLGKAEAENAAEQKAKEVLSGAVGAAKAEAETAWADALGGIGNSLNDVTANVKEQAVMAVEKAANAAQTKTKEFVHKNTETVKKGLDSFLDKNLQKVIPVGTVVNTGGPTGVKMSYRDYLWFYLFIMKKTDKIERIQSLIQANMRVGGQTDFYMEHTPVAVWANMEATIPFFFLSNAIVPEEWKQEERMKFKVISAQSY